jgi:hypothetical protein
MVGLLIYAARRQPLSVGRVLLTAVVFPWDSGDLAVSHRSQSMIFNRAETGKQKTLKGTRLPLRGTEGLPREQMSGRVPVLNEFA